MLYSTNYFNSVPIQYTVSSYECMYIYIYIYKLCMLFYHYKYNLLVVVLHFPISFTFNVGQAYNSCNQEPMKNAGYSHYTAVRSIF